MIQYHDTNLHPQNGIVPHCPYHSGISVGILMNFATDKDVRYRNETSIKYVVINVKELYNVSVQLLPIFI